MAEEAVLQQSISSLGRTLSAQLQNLNRSTMTFREAAVQQNKNVSSIIKDLFSAVSSQRREQTNTNEYLGQSIRDVEQSTSDNAKANDATRDELERVITAEYRNLSELSEIKGYLKDIDDNTHKSSLTSIFENIFTGSLFTTALATAFGVAVGGMAFDKLKELGGGGGSGATPVGPIDIGTGSGAGYESAGVNKQQVAEYIKEAAVKRGIDPNVAVRVANSEGLNTYVGDRGSSFGPYQLHYGGVAGGGMAVGGLGDEFTKKTGLDARDPKTWKQQVDFSLDVAKVRGWGDWHGWTGDKRAGLDYKGGATELNNESTTVTLPSTAPDAGRQQLPQGLPAPGQMQPMSTPTGMNGRLPDSMLQPIGQGHKLQPQAAAAYQQMEQAARKDGISWSITDSYRDYASQVRLAQQKGLYSQGGLAATPGTSKHGWGLAVDLGGGANEKNSKQNQWLQQNAARFGFSNIPREPWHWEYRGEGSTPLQPTSPTSPYTSSPTTGAVTDQSAPTVDQRLYSTNPSDIISAGRDMMRSQALAQGLSIPGVTSMGISSGSLSGGLPITSFGGAGMTNILNNLFGEDSSSLIQNQTSNILQQLQPQLQATEEIKNAAIQDKVATALQAKTPEPERRETEPSQFAQSHERHFPQGSFSEYNTDNHLYPEWASLVYDVYGKFTGSKGGNIKTSLA